MDQCYSNRWVLHQSFAPRLTFPKIYHAFPIWKAKRIGHSQNILDQRYIRMREYTMMRRKGNIWMWNITNISHRINIPHCYTHHDIKARKYTALDRCNILLGGVVVENAVGLWPRRIVMPTPLIYRISHHIMMYFCQYIWYWWYWANAAQHWHGIKPVSNVQWGISASISPFCTFQISSADHDVISRWVPDQTQVTWGREIFQISWRGLQHKRPTDNKQSYDSRPD